MWHCSIILAVEPSTNDRLPNPSRTNRGRICQECTTRALRDSFRHTSDGDDTSLRVEVRSSQRTAFECTPICNRCASKSTVFVPMIFWDTPKRQVPRPREQRQQEEQEGLEAEDLRELPYRKSEVGTGQ